MNVEDIRAYCLSLPLTTEDFPFDEDCLAFRVQGKIFAMINLENTKWFVLKCNPDYAVELREQHREIEGAWHMNKRYWNQLDIYCELSDELIKALIRHSYAEVVSKFSGKAKRENPVLMTVR